MNRDIIKLIIPLFGIIFGGCAGYIKQPWGFVLGIIYGVLVMFPFIIK